MSEMLSKEKDDKIISINGREDNPLIAIVGERKDGDENFVSVVDLGDIDHSRTRGADAAYQYLNGHPGQYAITAKSVSPKKVIVYLALMFIAGAAATIFATQM